MADLDLAVYSDAQLETLVISDIPDFGLRGAAKAELAKRQRAYELERDRIQREHENGLFDAESRRDVARKQFEERLAREQMQHAEKIATEQLKPAESSAAATRSAAWAAGFSAGAAIITAILSFLAFLDQHRGPPSLPTIGGLSSPHMGGKP